jgi:nitroreductase
MEFRETVRRRAMVRSFDPAPLAGEVVERVLGAALKAPTAGNTGGTAWVVLSGAEEVATYWDAVTDEAWRSSSPRWEGLRRAPVLLLAYSSADSYVARYGEPDKAGGSESGSGSGPGLGESPDAWTIPYWTGDAAFGVMSALLAAVDEGLGACMLGNFRGEAALAAALAVPDGWRLFGAIALGQADGADHPSPSLARSVGGPEERIHRGGW